jgi:hypothetical protein
MLRLTPRLPAPLTLPTSTIPIHLDIIRYGLTVRFSRCTWDDQGCHQVWYADRTKRIWGHMSRVCVGKTSSGKFLLYSRWWNNRTLTMLFQYRGPAADPEQERTLGPWPG